jgi:hypothetical protein
MGFFVKHVCDQSRQYSSGTPNYGKCVYPAGNPYQFYVDIAAGSNAALVNMVTPAGGPQSGFFRFPRVGEQVLICQTDRNGGYYLVGFVPSPGAPFYPQDAKKNEGIENGYNPGQRNPGNMDDFLDDKGMALRYKKDTNLNQPQERPRKPDGEYEYEDASKTANQKTQGKRDFSEIGFYNKKAKWPDAAKNCDTTKERLPEDKFSRIDVLNIQSTGDIESRAENYHLLKAKRVEFLADADEVSPETRADNCRNDSSEWTGDNAPLVDAPLDDPAVLKGDMHFRAGKNIVIKAAGEVRFQVGRTTLVIDDKGFSALTRKVNSNVPLPNDTSFSMSSRDGISMFGENVTIASARKFSFSDIWGAGVASMVGTLDISGKQINHKTYDKVQPVFSILINSIKLVQNMALGSAALNHPEGVSSSVVDDYVFEILNFSYEFAKTVYDCYQQFKNFDDNVTGLWNKRNAILDGYLALYPAGNAYNANASALVAGERNNPATPLDATNDVLGTASALVGLEPIEMLMAALNLVLDITARVYSIVDQSYAAKWRLDLSGSVFDGSDKKWTAQGKSDFRDTLNLVAMNVDNAIIEAAMLDLIASSTFATGGPASIRLRRSGDIVIKAGRGKNLYAEIKRDASVPVAIYGEKVAAVLGTAAQVASLAEKAFSLGFQAGMIANRVPAYLEKL